MSLYKSFFSQLYETSPTTSDMYTNEAYPWGGFTPTKDDFETQPNGGDMNLPIDNDLGMNTVRISDILERNIPTSPEKWARAKSAARSKFKVYPSAYANLWAAKKYKSMGGGWKKGKK
jgi:hypothetical protein